MALKILVVKKNADMTEGSGPMMPVAYFTEFDDALQCKNKIPGIMGTRSGIEIEEIIVFDNFNDWNHGRLDKIKKRALEKLTVEERKVLGFD